MKAKEIYELLKKGAYDVFRDDNYTEAQHFTDTDIDQMIERSSRNITYGSSGKSTMSIGMGSFSKAIFVELNGNGDGQDVDLDDPDFWEKDFGLESTHESIGEGFNEGSL